MSNSTEIIQSLSEFLTMSLSGANSTVISNQNTAMTKKVLTENTVADDIILSMYMFIQEKCDLYQEITHEIINID